MTYDECVRVIEKAEKDGATKLDLSGKGLEKLPPEIARLTELTSLNLGVEVWADSKPENVIWTEDETDLDDDGELRQDSERRTYLGYARFRHRWGLALKVEEWERTSQGGFPTYEYLRTTEHQPREVALARREIRMEAVKVLPDLLDAVKARAQMLLNSIEDSRSKLQE